VALALKRALKVGQLGVDRDGRLVVRAGHVQEDGDRRGVRVLVRAHALEHDLARVRRLVPREDPRVEQVVNGRRLLPATDRVRVVEGGLPGSRLGERPGVVCVGGPTTATHTDLPLLMTGLASYQMRLPMWKGRNRRRPHSCSRSWSNSSFRSQL